VDVFSLLSNETSRLLPGVATSATPWLGCVPFTHSRASEVMSIVTKEFAELTVTPATSGLLASEGALKKFRVCSFQSPVTRKTSSFPGSKSPLLANRIKVAFEM
jgi:hypothetical protein